MTVAAAANASKVALQTQQGWRSLIKPYIFSTVAIGTSVTTGDLICQYLERKSNNTGDEKTEKSSSTLLPWWDRERSMIMCTSAVLVSTPWSFTLSRVVERLFPGKQTTQIMKKMLTNILIAPVGVSLVFTTVTLLKGQSLRQARAKVQTDMPKTYLAGLCYWPFVSFLNFRFTPLNYRPFVGSIAGAIWNVYISSVANKAEEPLTGAMTTVIAETGGTAVPALQQTWYSSDKT